MNILIIGGTNFIGPILIKYLLKENYKVTVFTRGIRNVPVGVNSIKGNRDLNFAKILNKDWDFVIDTSGYFPAQLENSSKFFFDKCKAYIFISTVNVYKNMSAPKIDETYPTLNPLMFERFRTLNKKNYGPLKSSCEKILKKFFPNNHVILRPGYITGLNDPSKRLIFLLEKIYKGKDFFLPGTPDDLWQVLDVKDFAKFIVTIIQSNIFGTFNVTGPSIKIKEVLDKILFIYKLKKNYHWHPSQKFIHNLNLNNIYEWANLSQSFKYLYDIDNSKAIKQGLKFEPFAKTCGKLIDIRTKKIK